MYRAVIQFNSNVREYNWHIEWYSEISEKWLSFATGLCDTKGTTMTPFMAYYHAKKNLRILERQ